MIRPYRLVHFISTLVIAGILLNVVEVDAFQKEPGLYSPEDNVVALNNETLESVLSQPSLGKFVQFLNIFCGHCRRFVPTFKKLAIELDKWDPLISVYVVDCAKEQNVQICRNFEVKKTPTLRFFKSEFNRSKDGIGVKIETQKYDEILQILTKEVANNTYNYQGYPTFQVIGPNDNRDTVWETNNLLISKVEYIALIYQPKGSTIARDALLQLLTWSNIAIRIVEDENLFSNFITKYMAIHQSQNIKVTGTRISYASHVILKSNTSPIRQKIIILSRTDEPEILNPSEDSSDAYVSCIIDILKLRGFTPALPLSTTVAPNISFTMDQENQMILAHVLNSHLQIYRADLEQAIYKLLHIELPKATIIEGDSLVTLRSLLSWMASSKPLNEKVEKYLVLLAGKINNLDKLTGAQFEHIVQELENQMPGMYKTRRDVGCISSRPYLRGFTCSLWTFFHFLTVQATKTPLEYQPLNVLTTMHGFVKHYFGCEDCVNHFLEMAKRRNIDLPRTRDEDVLWLWKAHNEVNNRLANDSTEDPEFPKIQFPRKRDCPECYIAYSDAWDEGNVLKFLKRIYNSDNLSNFGYF